MRRAALVRKSLAGLATASLALGTLVGCASRPTVAVGDFAGTGLPAAGDTVMAEHLRFHSDQALSMDARFYKVIGQKPKPGTKIPAGTLILLKVTPIDVTVPDLASTAYSDALARLASTGLTGMSPDDHGDQAAWVVGSQDAAAGSQLAAGSTVSLRLVVPQVPVPNVVGSDPADAKNALTAGHLVTVDSPADAGPNWHVVSQTPAAGQSAPYGSTVTVVLEAPQIVYTVTGNGSRSNVITYTLPGGGFEIEQATDVRLPWSMSWPDTTGLGYGNLSAQDDNGTSISCSISVDGQVVDQQTATGRYAIVECNP